MFQTKVVERVREREREVYLGTPIIILFYFPINYTVIDSLYSLLDVRTQAEMVTVTDVLEEFGYCKKEFIRNLHNADRHQNLEPENT
jgi:hypothetical protein